MSVKSSLLIATLGISVIQPALASDTAELSSKGGFSYGKSSDPYWFKVNGLLQVDGTLVSGSAQSKSTQFHSNANLRRASIGMSGGVGNDWQYVFSLDMGSDRKLKLSDAFATYTGLCEGVNISIGQVNPSFSLENTSSSKWLPFLERSMPANAFGPDQGIGASITHWNNNYALGFSAVAPKKGDAASANRGLSASGNNNHNDQLVYSARASWAPIHMDAKLVQVGVSGHFENNKDGWLEFKSLPEITTRADSAVINTSDATNKNVQSKHHSTIAAEVAGQYGPLYGEAEYQVANVKRPAGASSLRFHGYHATLAYVLTGEHRVYNMKTGTFNQIVPDQSGAWEVAARHSYINLNSKDVTGGNAHNTTLGVNWYPTEAIKVSANYIRSLQTPNPAFGTVQRKLNLFGVRFQVYF